MHLRKRWAIVIAVLLLGAPAMPFVFIPVRDPGQLVPIVGTKGPARSIATDRLGNTFAADSDGVVAVNPRGERCWRLPLAAPEQCNELRLSGDTLLLLLTDQQHYAVAAVNPTDGVRRWRVDVRGDSPRAEWYLPRARNGHACGTLAVLSAGHLSVIGLARGELIGHVDLGATVGEPVWVEDSGFVIGTNGDRQSVVGVDLVVPVTAERSFVRGVWRAPLGETLTRTVWDPEGRVLLAYGAKGTYVITGR